MVWARYAVRGLWVLPTNKVGAGEKHTSKEKSGGCYIVCECAENITPKQKGGVTMNLNRTRICMTCGIKRTINIQSEATLVVLHEHSWLLVIPTITYMYIISTGDTDTDVDIW